MAALAGYAALVKNGVSTLTEVTDAELDLASDMYEISPLGGGRAKTYVPGLYGATFPCKMNWDASDTNGTIAFQTNVTGASPSAISFTLSPNGGTNNYTFSGYVKDMKINAPVNNKVTSDCTIQVSGAVTYA